MEILRRFGGTAGFLMVLSGAGIVQFLPGHQPWGWALLGAGFLPLLATTWLNREDLLNLLRGRPFRYGANAVFYSLLVLGIVGAVDFLAARHNRRFDLTAQGRHSVSPQTIQILDGLEKEEQEITIVAFFSPDPRNGKQKALDLLEQYRYHDPLITLKVLDPLRSPAEARAYEVEEDGTVIVSTKSGEARITPSRDGALSEENLTNAFIKGTAKSRKVVCVSTGHGERRIGESSPEGLQQASEAIKKESFEVREVRLLEDGGVPADCSSLLVPGPSHAFLQPEVEAVERYLKEGGRGLFLIEPRTATGLEPLLERYGLKTGGDFVVDVNPMSRILGGSPAAPVVYEYGSHAITKDFQGLATIFPTVGSVETTTAAEPDVTTEALAHTSPQSWGETGDLADRVSYDARADRPGPRNIAAAAIRKHRETSTADPNAAPAAEEEKSAAPARETRIVLFGDADHVSNGAFSMMGNRDLFLNTIAWLNERTDLISIRPKSQTPQPVVMTALQARILRWYSLVICPVLALAAGVGVYARRRRL